MPSDANGHYQISGLPAVGAVWVTAFPMQGNAFTWEYMPQCATTADVQGDMTQDLVVSSTADLDRLNSVRPPTPSNSRIVSGTIYVKTRTGREPLKPFRDVVVGWEASMDIVVAETRSDAAGRYLLCGLPTDRIDLFALDAYGNLKYATVDPGSDAVVDFELSR